VSRHVAVALGVLALVAGGGQNLPAAPVPKHLMRKENSLPLLTGR